MMDFILKNKTTIGGVVLLIILVWGYFTFFGGSTSAPLTATSSDSALSGNLLATLNSLHTIKLDNSIFSDPVFMSLSDFGTTLPAQPSGRGNPFAPVGSSSPAFSASSGTASVPASTQASQAPAGPTSPEIVTPPQTPPATLPTPPAQ